MNFHPNNLAHAAFIDRPRTLKELYQVVGIVEEKHAVAQERQRLQSPSTGAHNPRCAPRSGPARAVPPLKCWICGDIGHVTRDCPHREQPAGNGQAPEGR
jgi:hypothetical protein